MYTVFHFKTSHFLKQKLKFEFLSGQGVRIIPSPLADFSAKNASFFLPAPEDKLFTCESLADLEDEMHIVRIGHYGKMPLNKSFCCARH